MEKSTLYNVQHTPTELKNARCLALVMLLRAKRLETSYRDSAKHSGEAPISPSFHNTPHTHTHTIIPCTRSCYGNTGVSQQTTAALRLRTNIQVKAAGRTHAAAASAGANAAFTLVIFTQSFSSFHTVNKYAKGPQSLRLTQ